MNGVIEGVLDCNNGMVGMVGCEDVFGFITVFFNKPQSESSSNTYLTVKQLYIVIDSVESGYQASIDVAAEGPTDFYHYNNPELESDYYESSMEPGYFLYNVHMGTVNDYCSLESPAGIPIYISITIDSSDTFVSGHYQYRL